MIRLFLHQLQHSKDFQLHLHQSESPFLVFKKIATFSCHLNIMEHKNSKNRLPKPSAAIVLLLTVIDFFLSH